VPISPLIHALILCAGLIAIRAIARLREVDSRIPYSSERLLVPVLSWRTLRDSRHARADNPLAIFFAQVERFDGRKSRSCAVDSIYVAEQFTSVSNECDAPATVAGFLPSIFEWDMYRS